MRLADVFPWRKKHAEHFWRGSFHLISTRLHLFHFYIYLWLDFTFTAVFLFFKVMYMFTETAECTLRINTDKKGESNKERQVLCEEVCFDEVQYVLDVKRSAEEHCA